LRVSYSGNGWAWWVFLVVDLGGQLSCLVYVSTHPFSWLRLAELMLGFIQLALLLSTPMRRYERIRGRLRARGAPAPGSA
jgi:hypothetical protein